jgi:hypothetical protein
LPCNPEGYYTALRPLTVARRNTRAGRDVETKIEGGRRLRVAHDNLIFSGSGIFFFLSFFQICQSVRSGVSALNLEMNRVDAVVAESCWLFYALRLKPSGVVSAEASCALLWAVSRGCVTDMQS